MHVVREKITTLRLKASLNWIEFLLVQTFMKIKQNLNRIYSAIDQLLIDAASKKFILHNKIIWSDNKKFKDSSSEILCEFNGMHSAIIAYSYLSNLLSNKYQAKIVAFSEPSSSWLKITLYKLISPKLERIYKSFNTTNFIVISLSKKQKEDAELIFNDVYHNLKNKKDVENINIDGVHIGDLIYDTYLRKESVPTIDLLDKRFISSLKKSIGVYVFWRDYLTNHNVRAINVSHCVYNLAIPLRIAINRNISAYQINATHVYKLTKQNTHAYNDFLYYRIKFSSLSKDMQLRGIEEAKNRLERRFAGEVGVDMAYSKKSAYSDQKKKRVIRESNKIKLLIATHCFFDSPHPYGINIFPDFYEWLNFLGEISENTDYDWYIKTHPDFLLGNVEIINKFVCQYPKFTLIPSDTSHKQIIKEGINYALTVHGTIGFEYAALGVPVINASMFNPHIAYDFNIHPETIEQYRDVLMDLDNQSLLIDKQEVYEYYFMRFIYNNNDWLLDDYSSMIKELGGYREQLEPKVYDYFLGKFNVNRHQKTVKSLGCFIESNDFRMHYTEI